VCEKRIVLYAWLRIGVWRGGIVCLLLLPAHRAYGMAWMPMDRGLWDHR